MNRPIKTNPRRLLEFYLTLGVSPLSFWAMSKDNGETKKKAMNKYKILSRAKIFHDIEADKVELIDGVFVFSRDQDPEPVAYFSARAICYMENKTLAGDREIFDYSVFLGL